jgi:hypothetical protein
MKGNKTRDRLGTSLRCGFVPVLRVGSTRRHLRSRSDSNWPAIRFVLAEICVGSMAAAKFCRRLWPTRFWRPRFGLKTLFCLTLVVAVPCAILASKIAEKRRERDIVKRINERFGEVVYNWQYCLHGRPPGEPPGWKWCRTILGEDFFATVTMITCDPRATDDDMRLISTLQGVEIVTINFDWDDAALTTPYTGVTDAGLLYLSHLRNLKSVDLQNRCAAICDDAIDRLQLALPDCEVERNRSGTVLWFRRIPDEYLPVHYPPKSGRMNPGSNGF